MPAYASREEIERRLGMRGEVPGVIAEALRAADLLDASDVADLAVDTTGRSVDEVAGQVLGRVVDVAVAEDRGSTPYFDTSGRTPEEITRMILDWVSTKVGQWAAVGPGIAGGWHEQVCPGDPRET